MDKLGVPLAPPHKKAPPVTEKNLSSSLGKKVSLAAICLVAGSASLGYKSINVSMYHVPVPTYNDIFV